jgi:hypothetical protein
MECDNNATWVRVTQFAGSHPYCDEHAKMEADFGEDDTSYFFWKDLLGRPKENPVQPIRVGGTYKHKKGNLYRVDAIAKHTETLEEMVVYTALYENPAGKVWVRPLKMFQEPGRFTLVSDS